MENKRKNVLLVVVSLFLILVVGVFFLLWNPTPPSVVQMPVPNGYTSFAQAETLVQKQTFDFATMDALQLRSVVDANSNALQTARVGLAEKSRVPVEFSQQYISTHLASLAQMKLLAFAFLAEGRLAEMEQRTNDAVRAYLDAISLGVNSPRGGPLIDNLVGLAQEAMGTAKLQKVVPNLDAKTAAAAAHELEALDASKETWEEILQNEKHWMRGMYPGLQHRFAEILAAHETRAAKAKAKQRYETQQNGMHRLMLDLAAHAYQLDKGHRPANAIDLVPTYLKALPLDPITGKEMKLTP